MEPAESFRQAVCSEAKRNTWEFLGQTPRTFLLGIVSVIVVAIAKIGSGVSTMNLLVEIALDIIVGSILFLLVTFAVNLVGAPRKLYYKQQEVINRRGKVTVGAPSTYAALAHIRDDFLLVRLPLIFNNVSDVPVVVQGLRLTLEQDGKRSPVLKFNQTVSKLDIAQEGDWAKQFIVEGKGSVSLICEFLRKPRGGFVFSEGYCNTVLEGKFDNDQQWGEVTKFKLYTPAKYLEPLNSVRPPIPYSNDPDAEN